MSTIVILVLRLFPLGDKYLLVLDRTNWKWGKSPINILMLSIAYSGISIPLFWVVLDLEGNSCAKDRIDILKRVLDRLGCDKIQALLADREFVGTEWFHFLVAEKIPFVIRIKQNFALTIKGNIRIAAGQLRKWIGKKRVINHPANLWGYTIYHKYCSQSHAPLPCAPSPSLEPT